MESVLIYISSLPRILLYYVKENDAKDKLTRVKSKKFTKINQIIAHEVLKLINEEFEKYFSSNIIHLTRIIKIINWWLSNQFILKSGWYWKVFIEIKEVKFSLNQIYFSSSWKFTIYFNYKISKIKVWKSLI